MAGQRPKITQDCLNPLLETKFIRVYDMQYAPEKHYYNATRRQGAELVALKNDEEARSMLPDAVSCVVVVCQPGKAPQLLLSMEYRYPAGRFLLSVPAGLIDPEDRARPDALQTAAIREIREETGLNVGPDDEVTVINPFMYSTPGMTDESNALVGVVIHADDLSALDQSGAVGSELFDGFVLVEREEARQMMLTGRDRQGQFFSVYTMLALCWFVRGFGGC